MNGFQYQKDFPTKDEYGPFLVKVIDYDDISRIRDGMWYGIPGEWDDDEDPWFFRWDDQIDKCYIPDKVLAWAKYPGIHKE